MLDEIEYVKPADIEKRSMEIITSELLGMDVSRTRVFYCETVYSYICGL